MNTPTMNPVEMSKDQTYYWLREDLMLRPDVSVPTSLHNTVVSRRGIKQQISYIVGTFVNIISGSRHRVPLHELIHISVPLASSEEPLPVLVEIVNGKVISHFFCCEDCRINFRKTHKLEGKVVERNIRPKSFTSCTGCCKLIGSLV
jgi:hypothetical protein